MSGSLCYSVCEQQKWREKRNLERNLLGYQSPGTY